MKNRELIYKKFIKLAFKFNLIIGLFEKWIKKKDDDRLLDKLLELHNDLANLICKVGNEDEIEFYIFDAKDADEHQILPGIKIRDLFGWGNLRYIKINRILFTFVAFVIKEFREQKIKVKIEYFSRCNEMYQDLHDDFSAFDLTFEKENRAIKPDLAYVLMESIKVKYKSKVNIVKFKNYIHVEYSPFLGRRKKLRDYNGTSCAEI